jgi:hypothetical protein
MDQFRETIMKSLSVLSARAWGWMGVLALAGTVQAQDYPIGTPPVQTDEYTIQEQGSSPRGAGPGIPEEELGQDRRENARDNELGRHRNESKERDTRNDTTKPHDNPSQPKGGY